MLHKSSLTQYIFALGVIIIVLASLLSSCTPQPTTPSPVPRPTKTLRPTFTPLPTEPPQTATLEPTKSPAGKSSTSTPIVVIASSTPTTGVSTPTGEPPTAIPPTAVPESRAKHMKSPEYGMQCFLWYHPEVASRDVQLVKDAGFGWIKQGIGWRDVESAKGVFDWSRVDRIVQWCQEQGLDLLFRVDHQPAWARSECAGPGEQGPPVNLQDYADFLSALASRYRGKVRAYEIWNEPNLAREWCNQPPNAAEYVALLKIAYQAIKAADPEALVITAGLAPTTEISARARPDVMFLREMYEAGAKPYFDVLGVHGAGYKAPPEMDPGEVARDPVLTNNDPSPEELKRVYCFRHVEDLRAIMVEYGDADKQVAVLELGWTVDRRPDSPYYWHRVENGKVQADYLVRAYRYAKEHWTPWIGLMSLIYIADPDWTDQDEQYWWAITYPSWPEFKARPAYEALKAMPK